MPENQARNGVYDELKLSYPTSSAERVPDIPLEAYKMCVFSRSRFLELAYVCMSMFFGKASPIPRESFAEGEPHLSDIMTFSVIVCISVGVGLSFRGDGQPNILRTIVHDATIYFLGIFSAHFVSFIALSRQHVSPTAFVA